MLSSVYTHFLLISFSLVAFNTVCTWMSPAFLLPVLAFPLKSWCDINCLLYTSTWMFNIYLKLKLDSCPTYLLPESAPSFFSDNCNSISWRHPDPSLLPTPHSQCASKSMVSTFSINPSSDHFSPSSATTRPSHHLSLWLLPQPSNRSPCFYSHPSSVHPLLSCQIMSFLHSNPSYDCPSHSKSPSAYGCFYHLATRPLSSHHLRFSFPSQYSTNTHQLVFLQIHQVSSILRPFHSCFPAWNVLPPDIYMLNLSFSFAQMYFLSGADSSRSTQNCNPSLLVSLFPLYGFYFLHTTHYHQNNWLISFIGSFSQSAHQLR